MLDIVDYRQSQDYQSVSFSEGLTTEYATRKTDNRRRSEMIIDGMMHLEVMGEYWDGLVDEVIEHWDAAGIDKGVILATWMASRRSNDITLDAFTKYPDRFIPFGHVRPVDDWQSELDRITQDLGWTGLKLHQREIWYAGGEALRIVREMVARGQRSGLRVVKIHLHEYETIDALSREFPDVVWILPHMGQYMVPNAPLTTTSTSPSAGPARRRSHSPRTGSCTARWWSAPRSTPSGCRRRTALSGSPTRSTR
jgi:predicted TIM-barrel fold metal-dependent hydrolase